MNVGKKQAMPWFPTGTGPQGNKELVRSFTVEKQPREVGETREEGQNSNSTTPQP